MAYEPWTDEHKAWALMCREGGMTYSEIAESLNLRFATQRTENKVSDAFRKGMVNQEGLPDEVGARQATESTSDGATSVKDNRPYSDEEMAELFGIDTNIWSVSKRITNVWGTNFQTKVWWDAERRDLLASRWEELLAEIDPVPAPAPHLDVTRGGRCFFEVCLFDAHFGLLAWGPEAGEPDDLNLTYRRYCSAFRYMLGMVPDNVGYLLWCIGQDLYHFDTLVQGKGGATAKGTPQDVDSRWMKLFIVVASLHVQLISEARSKGLEVKIKIQPGNHDEQTSWHLGEYLQAWFRQDSGVEIDNTPAPRKYHEDGEVTIGYTHGHREKPKDLYRLMTKETGRVSKWMEWHRGHLHHENVQQEGDMQIRGMRPITLKDAWHNEAGYDNITGAQGFVWHPDLGLMGQVYWSPVFMEEGLLDTNYEVIVADKHDRGPKWKEEK